MTRSHYRFLILEQLLGSALFNLALNGAIGWLAFKQLTRVPLWGIQSIASDTLVTSFMLPFMTCVVVTQTTYWQVRSKRLQALGRHAHRQLARLPRRALARSVLFGSLGLAIAGPVLALLAAASVAPMSLRDFIIFKATYAAVMAAILTPPIALWALGDAPAPNQADTTSPRDAPPC